MTVEKKSNDYYDEEFKNTLIESYSILYNKFLENVRKIEALKNKLKN